MDQREIKAAFSGRLSLMCGPDTQDFLLHASPDEVYADTAAHIQNLGHGGGYIFGVSHTIQRGTPKKNLDAMLIALDNTAVES